MQNTMKYDKAIRLIFLTITCVFTTLQCQFPDVGEYQAGVQDNDIGIINTIAAHQMLEGESFIYTLTRINDPTPGSNFSIYLCYNPEKIGIRQILDSPIPNEVEEIEEVEDENLSIQEVNCVFPGGVYNTSNVKIFGPILFLDTTKTIKLEINAIPDVTVDGNKTYIIAHGIQTDDPKYTNYDSNNNPNIEITVQDDDLQDGLITIDTGIEACCLVEEGSSLRYVIKPNITNILDANPLKIRLEYDNDLVINVFTVEDGCSLENNVLSLYSRHVENGCTINLVFFDNDIFQSDSPSNSITSIVVNHYPFFGETSTLESNDLVIFLEDDDSPGISIQTATGIWLYNISIDTIVINEDIDAFPNTREGETLALQARLLLSPSFSNDEQHISFAIQEGDCRIEAFCQSDIPGINTSNQIIIRFNRSNEHSAIPFNISIKQDQYREGRHNISIRISPLLTSSFDIYTQISGSISLLIQEAVSVLSSERIDGSDVGFNRQITFNEVSASGGINHSVDLTYSFYQSNALVTEQELRLYVCHHPNFNINIKPENEYEASRQYEPTTGKPILFNCDIPGVQYGFITFNTSEPIRFNTLIQLRGNNLRDTNFCGVDTSLHYYISSDNPNYQDNENSRTVQPIQITASPKPFDGRSGDGNVDNPYLIDDEISLQRMNCQLDKNYKIMNNINASTITYYSPIGKDINLRSLGFQGTPFTGVLDGNNFTIRNFNVSSIMSSSIDYAGLFGQLGSGSRVFNLSLHNFNIKSCKYSGVLSGQSFADSVENITIRNSTININCQEPRYIGGMLGYTGNGSINTITIENVLFSGSTSGKSQIIGGIVGYQESGMIQNAQVLSTTIKGIKNIGGLTAYSNGNILDSNITANINISPTAQLTTELCSAIGGFVGNLGTSGRVQNSWFKGNIINSNCQETDKVGKFVGYNLGNIERSYAGGNISSITPNVSDEIQYTSLGGFAGQSENGTITQSYTYGDINLQANYYEDVGGFVGLASGSTMQETLSAGIIKLLRINTSDSVTYKVGGYSGCLFNTTVENSKATSIIHIHDSLSIAGFTGRLASGSTLRNVLSLSGYSYNSIQNENRTTESRCSFNTINEKDGFVGFSTNSNIENSYWWLPPITRIGLDTSTAQFLESSFGRETTQLMISSPNANTYVGWEASTWRSFSSTTFPTLNSINPQSAFTSQRDSIRTELLNMDDIEINCRWTVSSGRVVQPSGSFEACLYLPYNQETYYEIQYEKPTGTSVQWLFDPETNPNEMEYISISPQSHINNSTKNIAFNTTLSLADKIEALSNYPQTQNTQTLSVQPSPLAGIDFPVINSSGEIERNSRLRFNVSNFLRITAKVEFQNTGNILYKEILINTCNHTAINGNGPRRCNSTPTP